MNYFRTKHNVFLDLVPHDISEAVQGEMEHNDSPFKKELNEDDPTFHPVENKPGLKNNNVLFELQQSDSFDSVS